MSTVQPASGTRGSLARALIRAFAPRVLARGEQYLHAVEGEIDPFGAVSGTVAGSRDEPYEIRMMPSLDSMHVLLAACTCPAADDGACKHLWATLRVIDRSGAWPAELPLPTKLSLTTVDDPELDLISTEDAVRFSGDGSGIRGARRLVPKPPSWRERLDAWPTQVPSVTAKLALVEYVIDARSIRDLSARNHASRPLDERGCTVLLATCTQTKATHAKPSTVRRKYGRIEPARLAPADREVHQLLFGIEDLVEYGWGSNSSYFHSSQNRSGVRIASERIADVLPRIAATGRLGWLPDGDGLVPLAWDDGGAWQLEIGMTSVSAGRVRASGSLVRDSERIALDTVDAIAGGGIAIAQRRILQVATEGLARWCRLVAGGVELPADELPSFFEATAQPLAPPRFELAGAGWHVEASSPVQRIVITRGDRVGFEARAELIYGGATVQPGARNTLVDAAGKRMYQRDATAEQAASRSVAEIGGSLERPWSVAGAQLRELATAAATRGWEVWYEGARVRSNGAIAIQVTTGIDWFDVTLDIRDGSSRASLPELLSALRSGRPLVKLSDGSTVFVPSWLEARAAALTSAVHVDGALRFRPAEALVVASLLERVPEVQVDEGFARLREQLETFKGLEPRSAPRGFAAKLRDYQREGLGWLWFLRGLGLGGCLADDMGLGKTVQVLALVDGIRVARKTPGKPSLVVAPKSLVFHWLDEARRFAPKLRTVEWHGTTRASKAAELHRADLIVTTYGTLRKDIQRLGTIDFDLVVLDEAHAIKTASTATAKATYALRADHRLALTGTPVENRLDDLASIFEFLNPGLLGRPAALRAIAPAESDEPGRTATDRARARALGKVLRPFLLRRTKQEVLAELPAKTEQIIGCRLEGTERKRYDELRLHYRRALLPAVEKSGVGKNAIVVLEALLRLRQAALHPGLLDPHRAGEDSAKLDALVEHLHEVIASGHRALVFSQFTTLLAIVRSRLERSKIAYEYLDGQTRDRRDRVAAFQTGTASVFLLSLKVGGTGLNLTAADHVFLLDPWWNPAVEAQAIDRVHRIGQSRPVTAYRLVAEDTVEQKILALQDHKRALFESVFEDKGVVARLSANDLRALLD